MVLTTDVAVLAKEAANFERIAGELKNVIAQVERTAADLMGNHWKGFASDAAQQAITRFQQAAEAQVRELNDISTNVHAAGAQYSATDDERAGAVAAAMGSAMGGPTNGNPAPQAVHPAAANGHGAATPQTAPTNTTGSGFSYGGTAPGVYKHSTDAPNSVRLVDFKTDGPGPAPTPTPTPAPPRTGEPIRMPPRTTPPPTVITAAPPDDAGHEPKPGFEGCSGLEQAQDLALILGGLATIGVSIPGETVTGGAATAGIIGGGTMVSGGVIGLDECSK
ncbi:WXG100 family type VII secretion target [Mycobacterium kyorinense]|uniref:WXG100 family type VII secretion target n=1 Tax=Mycobacterium kyorinense TaxID=487514 RepID=UPI00084C04CC